HHAAPLDVGGLVTGLEAAFDAIEERGGQGHVAVGPEAVGHLLDVRVHAEDLLHDDDPAARRAGGHRAIGRQAVAVLGRQRQHLTHGVLLRLGLVARPMQSRPAALGKRTRRKGGQRPQRTGSRVSWTPNRPSTASCTWRAKASTSRALAPSWATRASVCWVERPTAPARVPRVKPARSMSHAADSFTPPAGCGPRG